MLEAATEDMERFYQTTVLRKWVGAEAGAGKVWVILVAVKVDWTRDTMSRCGGKIRLRTEQRGVSRGESAQGQWGKAMMERGTRRRRVTVDTIVVQLREGACSMKICRTGKSSYDKDIVECLGRYSRGLV